MKLHQRAIQKQTIKQQLNPKLIQLFKIYHASYSDLTTIIKDESDQNVFIEIEQDDQLLNLSPTKTSQSTDTLFDKDLAEYTKTPTTKTLHEYLLSQLKELSISQKKQAIIQQFIEHLDNRGFFTDYPTASANIATSLAVSPSLIRDALSTLQQFEPEGVGARSLEECLMIQLECFQLENDELNHCISTVIKHHLTDLSEQNYALIASRLSISEEGVEAIADFIKENLNPNPGSNFSNEVFNTYITPSFEVNLENDTLTITNLERRFGVRFSLSQHYISLIDDPKTDAKTKAFLKEKHAKAKELSELITQRYDTIENLVKYICETQLLFIKKGSDFLVPLLQKDVASHLSLAPSTVSRILSSKFCRTPHGVVPLAFLCPRNYYGKTKEQFKLFIAHYLETYPKYSDKKIAALLAQQGISIARRTVSKYRKELGFSSSYFEGRDSDSNSISSDHSDT